jgi:hypothetical protein
MYVVCGLAKSLNLHLSHHVIVSSGKTRDYPIGHLQHSSVDCYYLLKTQHFSLCAEAYLNVMNSTN